VNIRWDVIVDGETPHFRMSWEEVDGPPVGHTDGHVGFGRKILINMVEYTLDAAVSLTYPGTGCRWSFTAPLERVRAKGGQRAEYRDTVSAASLFAIPEP
jgi:two-component sensor histidine kinase